MLDNRARGLGTLVPMTTAEVEIRLTGSVHRGYEASDSERTAQFCIQLRCGYALTTVIISHSPGPMVQGRGEERSELEACQIASFLERMFHQRFKGTLDGMDEIKAGIRDAKKGAEAVLVLDVESPIFERRGAGSRGGMLEVDSKRERALRLQMNQHSYMTI